MRRMSEASAMGGAPSIGAPAASLRPSARMVTFSEMLEQGEVPGQPARKRGDPLKDDPAVLIKEFDAKLKAIQEMLQQYQQDKQGAGAAASRPQALTRDDVEQQLAEAQARRKRVVTEEEAYRNSKIERRVRSAGPGATRTLSAKIEYFRSNSLAAEALAARAAEYARQKEELKLAELRAKHPEGLVDYVQSNKRSIMSDLPPQLHSMLGSMRKAGLAGMRNRQASSVPGRRPVSAMAFTEASFGRPVSSAAAGAASMAGQGWGAPQAGAASVAWASGGSVSASGASQSAVGNRPPSPSVVPQGSAPPGSSGSASGQQQQSGFTGLQVFLTSVDVQGLTAAASAPTPSAMGPVVGSPGGPLGRPPRPTTAAWPASPSGRSMPASPSGAAGPGSPAGGPGTSYGGSWGFATGSSGSGQGPGSGVGPLSMLGVSNRQLRLALTARPATGGSPTSRPEFLAEQAVVRADRSAHALDVRSRAAELDTTRRQVVAATVEAREKRRAEELARQAKLKADHELYDRQQQWTGVVAVATKLSFIVEQIQHDRSVRSLRAIRKEAAVRIATWYKGILLRRRQRELVETIQRLRRLIKPYLAANLAAVRQNCALRIVDFLRMAESSNMAVVAVRKFKAGVDLLQRQWRTAVLLRAMQRTVLFNSFTKYDKDVAARNKKTSRMASLQTARLGKAVSIMEPTASLTVVGPGGAGATSHLHNRPSSRRSLAAAAGAYSQLCARSGGGGSTARSHATGGGNTARSRPQSGASHTAGGAVPRISAAGASDAGGAGSRGSSPGRGGVGPAPPGGGYGLAGLAALAGGPSQYGGDMFGGGRGGDGGGEGSRSVSPGRTGSRYPSPPGGYPRPRRGGLVEDTDDDDEMIKNHLDPLPKEIRQQVVDDMLQLMRREYYQALERYRQEKQIYLARRPIEELRRKMLKDAGLPSMDLDTPPPTLPRIQLLQPRSKLRDMLRQGIMIKQQIRRQQEMEEQEQFGILAAARTVAGGGTTGGGRTRSPSPTGRIRPAASVPLGITRSPSSGRSRSPAVLVGRVSPSTVQRRW